MVKNSSKQQNEKDSNKAQVLSYTSFSYFLAFLLRFLLICYGQWQDQRFNVKYTDIDYFVFTDAARYVVQGQSAFQRHTYRYTPLLAHLLIPNVLVHPAFGKLLFSLADVVTGALLKAILQQQGLNGTEALKYACVWMLNPLSMNISTRGSSESLIAVMVLLAVWTNLKGRATLSGLALGIAVHLKIYPIIYIPTLALHLLSMKRNPELSIPHSQGFTSSIFLKEVKALLKSFFTGGVVNEFCISAAISFLFLTLISYAIDGDRYLWDGLFYHLSRTDHRHNFSMWWYPIYLDYDNPHKMSLGTLLLLPQLLLLVIIAFVFAPRHLPFGVFLQTMVFVICNKVFTGQYFSWYLSLLPLVLPHLKLPLGDALICICGWAGSLGLWLLNGYMLEFKGEHFFLALWICSLIFYAVNCTLVCKLVRAYSK